MSSKARLRTHHHVYSQYTRGILKSMKGYMSGTSILANKSFSTKKNQGTEDKVKLLTVGVL